MPTATTYLKSHKRADKRTALQSLKDRFDYGLNPEKLGAVSSYLCDPATAHAEFMLVKNQYQGETDRRAGHGALCYQIRQAFPHGEVTPEEAKSLIQKTDKRRASYCEYYASKKWGAVDAYDFCLNSSALGLGGTVELIQAMVAHKEHPIPSPTEIDPTQTEA